MLKILQARLEQYVNYELPHVQTGFRKGRDQTANILLVFWEICMQVKKQQLELDMEQ